MLDFFQRLFESSFMPHGHCYLWKPGLVWLQAGSEALIALAYFLISYLLFWFVRRRKDLAFKWMFAFGAMLFGFCAITHVLGITTIWYGTYWVEGSFTLVTGVVSLATAGLMIPVMPKALNLPTPSELRKANQALEDEIEQRKEAEKELEDAYAKLKETERLKDEFFANVSHELRTPLTLILSPVESMLEADVAPSALDSETSHLAPANSEGSEGNNSGLSEDHRQKLQTVHNNAIRMLQMVNGLLDFSQLEIGEVNVDREPTNVADLTHSIAQDFGPLSARKGIELDLASTVDHPVVDIDRYLYERILFNLLSNAVKFTPSGGEVNVRLTQQADRLRLAVADTGEGIPEDQLDTIFKDFRQVDASSTRRFEGTGLGLPLVQEFTQLLGGEVSVESTPGEGSTFTVDVQAPPATRSDAPDPQRHEHSFTEHYDSEDRAEAAESLDPSRPDGSVETAGEPSDEDDLPDVVLAEDNAELSAYIRDLLADTCRVHVASNGEEATRQIWALDPALVITDIMMPEKDGLNLCRELKSNHATSDIPVVMLTALTNRKALLRGWEAGADEYLFKPFHPRELITRIRTLLRNVERRKEAEEIQKRLEQKLLRVNERERRRIGQDLHDSLTSHMTGVSMLAQSLLRGKSNNHDETLTVETATLERIVNLAQEGAQQARAMARGLNPVKLDQKGLPAALQTLSEDQELQFEVTCSFEQIGELPILPDDLSINLYWIAHEAVRNAIRHGDADRISIRLRGYGDDVTLEIVDDGRGLPSPPSELDDGMGLATMRYRADLVGAEFGIENREDGGVRVSSSASVAATA